MAVDDGRLLRINVPTPNPAIAEALVSPRMADLVEAHTEAVLNVYRATLPRRTGNLRDGAYHYMALSDWDDGYGIGQRWFGYVGNRALSYRGKRGVRYAGVIEYGEGSRAGQGHLRRALATVMGHAAVGSLPAARNTTPRSYGDRNPKTGNLNFRDRKGAFTKSPLKGNK